MPILFFSLFFPLLTMADIQAEIGAYSNFIWRGTTFTENRPAIQGELDAEAKNGFYFGSFISNAEFSDASKGSNATVTQEIDFTIGKRWKGSNWEIQAYYSIFTFPGAEAYNTDEWNLQGKYKNFLLELSWLDDYFGYHGVYRYARIGHEWVYKEGLDGAFFVGHNMFERPKGSPVSSGGAKGLNGAGNKNYFDFYWVSRKTFENQMAVELAFNWTNREEYYIDDNDEDSLRPAKDFATIVAFIFPFTL
jgi:hypothetical protein